MYECVINGVSNVFIHNFIDSSEDEQLESNVDKDNRKKTLPRQVIFYLLLGIETIVIWGVILIKNNTQDEDTEYIKKTVCAFVFVLYTAGLSICAIYYKFFHIWSDINSSLDSLICCQDKNEPDTSVELVPLV